MTTPIWMVMMAMIVGFAQIWFIQFAKKHMLKNKVDEYM